MKAPFDLLAKEVIEEVCSLDCVVSIQEPVLADFLYADAIVDPPADPRVLDERGLLGRMVRERCAIEPFSRPPSVADIDRCMARVSLLRADKGLERALWVVSPGLPRSVIDEWALRPQRAWPRGVYSSRLRRLPRVVVVRELPRSRDTLMLRLMGRDEVLSAAIDDVRALPSDSWELPIVRRALLHVRTEIARMTRTEETSEEDAMRNQQINDEADRLFAEAEARGEARGAMTAAIQALRAVLSARGFALDSRTSERIERCSDRAELQRWIERAVRAPTLASVFDD
jgi:hypothetical protein